MKNSFLCSPQKEHINLQALILAIVSIVKDIVIKVFAIVLWTNDFDCSLNFCNGV